MKIMNPCFFSEQSFFGINENCLTCLKLIVIVHQTQLKGELLKEFSIEIRISVYTFHNISNDFLGSNNKNSHPYTQSYGVM